MTKLLHMPTGLVVTPTHKDSNVIEFTCGGLKGYHSTENFKPLSEFNKGDLQLGDVITTATTFYVLTLLSECNFDNVESVTRNNVVIYEREVK